MKFEKQVSLKWAIALVLIACLVSSSIVYYVFAVSPSSAFTISSGVYPGAPSYTVWREGSNYFAKDANGEIDYSGTNASYVIQSVINTFTSGGKIFFKQATYQLSTALTLKAYTTLEGENWNTIIKSTSNIRAIQMVGTDPNGEYGITIRNLCIEGTNDSLTGLHLYHTIGFLADHVLIRGHGLYCLYLENSYNAEFNHVQFSQHLEFGGGEYESVGSVEVVINSSNTNTFIGCVFANSKVAAIELTGTSSKNVFLGGNVENNYDVGVWIEHGYDNEFNGVWFEAIPIRTLDKHVLIKNATLGISNARNTFFDCIFQSDPTGMVNYGIYIDKNVGITKILYSQFYSMAIKDIYIGSSSDFGTTIIGDSFTTMKITDNGVSTQIHFCWNGTTWIP